MLFGHMLFAVLGEEYRGTMIKPEFTPQPYAKS